MWFLGGQSWGFVNALKYFHIFDDPQATQKYEHHIILLFLVNLAYSLIGLAVSKLLPLFIRKKNAVEVKFISGVTFSSKL